MTITKIVSSSGEQQTVGHRYMTTKPHILFVCGRNQWRSPTAAKIYANDQRIEVRSAGVSPLSPHRVNRQDLEWADLILVMETKHEDRLVEMFRDMRRPAIACLEIPDDFDLMDDELVELIREGTEAHLAAWFRIGHIAKGTNET